MAGAAFAAPVSTDQAAYAAIIDNPDTLGEYVREYFADAPVMADIAWCESRMRHINKDGTIFRGTVDRDDIGVMQINTRYHLAEAKEMGIDIYSLSGNLAYARHIYEKQGLKPWYSSSPCWSKMQHGE